jgi:hypothetical protein
MTEADRLTDQAREHEERAGQLDPRLRGDTEV